MGQIVSSAAKPKRCNLNKLSQLGTPAAGEYILVSSDNSMNAAGQGNFDAYVVGDGRTAAAALPLIKTYANVVDEEPTAGSDKLVKSGGVHSEIEDINVLLEGFNIVTSSRRKHLYKNDGTMVKINTDSYFCSPLLPVANFYKTNDEYIDILGTRLITYDSYPRIVCFDRNKTFISGGAIVTAEDYRFKKSELVDGTFFIGLNLQGADVTNAILSGFLGLRAVSDIKDDIAAINNSLLGKIEKSDIVDEVGVAYDKIMSQETVSSELTKRDHIYDELDVSTITWSDGYVYLPGGTDLASQTAKRTGFIPIPADAKSISCLVPSTSNSEIHIGVAFYSNVGVGYNLQGKEVYGYTNQESDKYREKTFDIPSNARYFRISLRTQYVELFYCRFNKTTVKEQISVCQSEIGTLKAFDANIEQTISELSKPLDINYLVNTISGAYWSASRGIIKTPDTLWKCSPMLTIDKSVDMIPIAGNLQSIANIPSVIFYNSSKAIIGTYSPQAKVTDPQFGTNNAVMTSYVMAIPEGAVYFTVSQYMLDSSFSTIKARHGIHTIKRREVTVAAYDAISDEKLYADYVCDGVSDEVELKKAINLSSGLANKRQRVKLSCGTFNIDTFEVGSDGVYRALPINGANTGICYVSIEGSGRNNTSIWLSNSCIASIDDVNNEYRGISAPKVDESYPRRNIYLYGFAFRMRSNQKKIVMIDLFNFGIVDIKQVGVYGCVTSIQENITLPVEGCIGIRATNGWNSASVRLTDTLACCCYEGFQLGGEHVVLLDCGGIFNYYSYTFGNYDWQHGFTHPITLISCYDERGVCLPKFVRSGYHDENYQEVGTGPQNIDFIDFNIERGIGSWFGNPSEEWKREHMDNAVVVDDKYFGGSITYTQLESTINGVGASSKFFKSGGSNFSVRNIAHKLKGSSALRRTYGANWWQTYYDTDLNKMLTYNGEHWIDAAGNIED